MLRDGRSFATPSVREVEEVIKKAREEDLLAFAQGFLGAYATHGFQSLSKRDTDLLLFYTLETSGVLDSRMSNHDTARRLRLTPKKVSALRREAWARWASPGDVQEHLRQTLRATFKPAVLKRVLQDNLSVWKKERLVPLLLEHPSDHSEVEQFLKTQHCIPHYAKNREVLLVPHDQIVPLLEHAADGLDAKRQREIKKSFAENTTLKELITKDLSKLSWEETRAALNQALGAVFEKAAVDAAAKALSGVVSGFLG